MLTDSGIVDRLRASSTEFRELEESHHKLDAELGALQKQHAPRGTAEETDTEGETGEERQDGRTDSSV